MNIEIRKIKTDNEFCFSIDDSPLKNPFIKTSGWNSKNRNRMIQYEKWFNSNLIKMDNIPFVTFYFEMLKQHRINGKIILVCSCRKKKCISKIIMRFLNAN